MPSSAQTPKVWVKTESEFHCLGVGVRPSKTFSLGSSSPRAISTPLPGMPHPLPEMGTTSSAPPGSSTLPAPSRPEGPARSCPPTPVSPNFSLPEASGQRGGAGAQRPWCPLAGVSPIRGTASPPGHRPAPCFFAPPPAPAPGALPCPHGRQEGRRLGPVPGL